MTSVNFCLADAAGTGGDPKALDAGQVDAIKAHLAMVFAHEIDPSQGTPEHVAELRSLHDRKPVCGHPVGSRACTLPAGHPENMPHAFDAGQAQRNMTAEERLARLEGMAHPRSSGDLPLMC
jgi:hypothetical protein